MPLQAHMQMRDVCDISVDEGRFAVFPHIGQGRGFHQNEVDRFHSLDRCVSVIPALAVEYHIGDNIDNLKGCHVLIVCCIPDTMSPIEMIHTRCMQSVIVARKWMKKYSLIYA